MSGCKVRDLLAGIITMTALFSINLQIAGLQSDHRALNGHHLHLPGCPWPCCGGHDPRRPEARGLPGPGARRQAGDGLLFQHQVRPACCGPWATTPALVTTLAMDRGPREDLGAGHLQRAGGAGRLHRLPRAAGASPPPWAPASWSTAWPPSSSASPCPCWSGSTARLHLPAGRASAAS